MFPPPRAALRPRASTVTALLAMLVTTAAAAPPAQARGAGRRAAKAKTSHAGKKAAHRQPKEVPNQEGKIVVFPIDGDDDHSITAQVERLLRARGLEVATDVRRVDTAEQFRELTTALGFVAYVDGTFKETPAIARLSIQVRSGYSGRRVALASFRESKLHLRAEVEEKLWSKVGPAIARACVDAGKPRKRDRDPLMIEAGTPLADKN
jgi:hypothetical protein